MVTKYIAKYFLKTKEILKKEKKDNIVTMQFFQRNDNVVLCGIKEVLELLKKNTNTKKYSIKYLPDGTIINNKEVVLELEGQYQYFGILEGMIDGILARSSSIATNARNAIIAAGNKLVTFMGDRADHYMTQAVDGYSAYIGGIRNIDTTQQIKWLSEKPAENGSIPHLLIQEYEGDLVQALKAYKKVIGGPVTGLVDFNNDVIGDSLKCLKEFGAELEAVRVDTSKAIRDKMFNESEDEFGVTSNMIKRLRTALDDQGGKHVKIIVSSGFTPAKIAQFEQEGTPVDVYGVGADMMKVWVNFSADAVKLNGKEIAKFGRGYSHNPKLIKF